MSTKRERKAFTTKIIDAKLNFENAYREVGITSGIGGISLWVTPRSGVRLGNSGVTNLTPAQAREMAQDLIERADEIESDPRRQENEQ